MLTGNVGTDLILLSKIDDMSLCNLSQTNKYCYQLYMKDLLWKYKILSRYGSILNRSLDCHRTYYIYLYKTETIINEKLNILKNIIMLCDESDKINNLFKHYNDNIVWKYFVIKYYGKDIDLSEIKKLIALGVDGVITDRPDLLMRVG